MSCFAERVVDLSGPVEQICRVLQYLRRSRNRKCCVLHGGDVSKHVFYRMLASKMVLWLEFWKRRCALARVLDGPGIERVVFCGT